MQGILYEEPSAWLFLLVTVVMGGWAAWMTGKAIAKGWNPVWRALAAFVPLAAVVRFFHFALFDGTLLSLHYYLVDLCVVAAIGAIGFQATRARQMTTQYRWLYEPSGPLSWRERQQPDAVSSEGAG